MKPICFYHDDMDGRCAGAIVNLAVPDLELRAIQYGDAIELDDVRGRRVYMVDFCLQPFELMEELQGAADYLVWIDHHKSAIDTARVRGFYSGGVLSIKWAACELAWAEFNPRMPTPRAVRLLGRYDVWDHSDPATLPFQYGMRVGSASPSEAWWWEMLFKDEDLEGFLSSGHSILRYIEFHNAECAGDAFEVVLDELRCIAMNRMRENSKLFDTVYDPDRHDAMLTFGWRDGQWTFSLYSTREDVDVSEVAKRYGGGGHKGAAGFQRASLPFTLPRRPT